MVACVIVLGWIIPSVAIRGADWPTYRHDAARSAATDDLVTFPLHLQWRYVPQAVLHGAWAEPEGRVVEGKELRDRLSFDDAVGVAVVAGRVFFGSPVDHHVYCLDAATGKPIWRFATGAPIRLAPTVASGRVYVGSDDGYAYCLDADSGKLLWSVRLGPADETILARGDLVSRWPVRTGILVDQGTVYFGAGLFPHEDVYLAAVDAASGRLIWKNEKLSHLDAGRNDLSPQGYLLATERYLFVPSGRSRPRAFMKSSGEMRGPGAAVFVLRATTTAAGTRGVVIDDRLYTYSLGTRVAVDGAEMFVADGKHIARLDRKRFAAANARRIKWSGQLRSLTVQRRRDRSKADQLKQQIADIRRKIAASADEGVMWRVPCPADGALIATRSAILVGDRNRVLALSRKDGSTMWQGRVEGNVRELAAAGGHLFVSTSDGAIHVFGSDPRADVAGNNTKVSSDPAEPFAPDGRQSAYARAAAEILKTCGVKRGYCLVLDAGDGRLAYELARQSALTVHGVETDPERAAKGREALLRAGLYGHRVTIHTYDGGVRPLPSYFANLIVSDRMVAEGRMPDDPQAVARKLKPFGGVICLGPIAGGAGEAAGAAVAGAEVDEWLARTRIADQSERLRAGRWMLLRRGALPGAGNWSHQYADPGNSANSGDKLVGGGLGVLWYGDPGPDQMVNRHQGAVGPLVVNGRLFIQGTDHLMAYDVYNGLLLWKQPNPKAVRTGVFQNRAPGNLAASDDRLFHMVRELVYELDAATGKVVRVHHLPPSIDARKHEWGYVAYRDGLLFGTATQRKVIDRERRRRGDPGPAATDAIFAIDLKTGKHLWQYRGGSIEFQTIALGPGRVYFIDSSVTSEERAALLREDKSALRKLQGEAARKAEARMKELDVRLAVALDARTGEKQWARPVDVTDCSEIGIGGGKLTLIYHDGSLVLCGANANGHYWRQFVAGEFKQRRLVVLSARDGYKRWAKDANYRHRPIIVGSRIIAEPWAFDLKTGKQITRTHPITGEEVPWSIMRPGHHCGMLTASDRLLLFRSGSTGFYDLQQDAGTRHFAGHRLGCWINAIPTNGLVVIPEASAGCVCMFSIASTIVLEPREPRRPWSIYSGVGATLPVRRLTLNLGAPGDRRGRDGTLWLAYPRPIPNRALETSLDLKLDFPAKFLRGGAFIDEPGDEAVSSGNDWHWIGCSGARGLARLVIPLRNETSGPGTYRVRLLFARRLHAPAGACPFNVKLQGRVVAKQVDTGPSDDGTPVVVEASRVDVKRELVIEIVPQEGKRPVGRLPVLSGIDIRLEEAGG